MKQDLHGFKNKFLASDVLEHFQTIVHKETDVSAGIAYILTMFLICCLKFFYYHATAVAAIRTQMWILENMDNGNSNYYLSESFSKI